MSFDTLTPMLYTRQLRQTIQFYEEKLGFTRTAFKPDRGWASLQRDGVSIMLSLPNDHLTFDGPAFTGSFYFYTNRVDELWKQLNGSVVIAYPIEDFDHGMREFAIYDNNGYMLQFGQAIN